jgi:hypothetical protein
MSIYVLALHSERKMLFRFKCMSAEEGRSIVRRLSVCFGHCLNIITLCHRRDDHLLFKEGSYNKVKNLTYEQNRYWYISRSNYDL